MFNHITRHEEYRKAVKELVYDTSCFNEPAATNIDDYTSQLVDQLCLLCNDWSVASRAPQFELFNRITSHEIFRKALKEVYLDFDESGTTNLDGYCSVLCKNHGQLIKEGTVAFNQHLWHHDIQALWDMYGNGFLYNKNNVLQGYEFVQEGQQVYQKLVNQESNIRGSGEYLSTIVTGLQSLPNLEHVTICEVAQSQSPFGRSWPFHYLAPHSSPTATQKLLSERNWSYHEDCHFLIRALWISSRKVKSLLIRPATLDLDDFCPYPSDMRNLRTEYMPMSRYILDVSRSLKTLHLVFTVSSTDDSLRDALAVLKSCLVLIRGLTDLHLDARECGMGSPISSALLSDIVPILSEPPVLAWPALRYFDVYGITVTELDLVNFLTAYRLRSFTMGKMNIVGTSWASTLDAIRARVPEPQKVCILGPLIENDNYASWEQMPNIGIDIYEAIQMYMECVGVNPMLPEAE